MRCGLAASPRKNRIISNLNITQLRCKNMGIETQIQLFDNAKIRVAWDDEKEKYFFSVVDVLHVLTDSANPQTYWRVLKKRLLDEGNETVTNCNQLKLPASDGKMRLYGC